MSDSYFDGRSPIVKRDDRMHTGVDGEKRWLLSSQSGDGPSGLCHLIMLLNLTSPYDVYSSLGTGAPRLCSVSPVN